MPEPEYKRGHLGSRPKLTVDTVSKQIANMMEFVNVHPEMTQTQLETLDRKIKSLHKSMEAAYLVAKSKSKSKSKNSPRTRRNVRFVVGTNSRGGNTKRRR